MDLLEAFFNEYLEEDPETKIYRVNLKYKINQFLFEKSMEFDTDLFQVSHRLQNPAVSIPDFPQSSRALCLSIYLCFLSSSPWLV